jgi:hypothetical protein
VIGYNILMGILDNLENAWDIEVRPEPQNPKFESSPFPVTDNMGREVFWEDLGRPEEPNLAVKLFSETVCSGCDCQK